MNKKKRGGVGGNLSKNPRGNVDAQEDYRTTVGANEKHCTGFLHHDTGPVPITSFRQQRGNTTTGLQSRCDTCNRQYFTVIQKPIKKIAATVIWANATQRLDWQQSCPPSLTGGISSCLAHWTENPCVVQNCWYETLHGDYRDSAAQLTSAWKNLDHGPRISSIKDAKTGAVYPAPLFMHDLQRWAGIGGLLWDLVDTAEVWEWWCDLYPEDTATCSLERNAVTNGEIEGPAPEHPLSDFPWGSGNILQTAQGHSTPGFNQVRAAVRVLPRSSNIGGRVYGYLAEGNHIEMAKFSARCKTQNMSLGHSPAPLRWLGKNDPINGKAQPLKENVALSDSLAPLHAIAEKRPKEARQYVSWQIADHVEELGSRKVTFEHFTQSLQARVEEYFDQLELSLVDGPQTLLSDLERADPGQPASVYIYRAEKVARWLSSRPSSKRNVRD